MSRVGDVDKMYGKNFSIVTTNASASDILNDNESSFIEASLILASPVDDFGNDLGYPTLLATDAEGNPIRLTYTIKPGNGLVLAYTYESGKQDFSEVISLAIDNDTLQTTEYGNLYVSAKGITENSKYTTVDDSNNIEVDIKSLIDNNRLVLTKIAESDEAGSDLVNRITVDASKIIDGVTLISNQTTSDANITNFKDQAISLNIKNIVDGSSVITSLSNDGREVLTAYANGLDKASSTTYGVIKIDNSTIKTNSNGNIYVDTNNLKRITSKGGLGIVRLEAQGKSDLYVDNSGFVRTDPKYMPKCSVINKAKTSSGFGVCAVDGKTIGATHDGVLKVISSGLVPASSSDLGVVKPDNKTIVIDKSGTISVNSSNLPTGTATVQGLLKIDNSTIVKNSQGQISIAKAKQWDIAISDLSTRISSLSDHITSIRADLGNAISTITNAKNATFKLFTPAGKDLQRMSVLIPNVTAYKNGTHDWNTADCGGTFTLQYGAGYVFTCSLVGATNYSWMSGCKIIINGQAYSMNQEIKLSSNTATCSLQLSIAGTGNISRANQSNITGSWTLDFKDSSGNPLKSITLSVTYAYSKNKTSDFNVTFNAALASTALSNKILSDMTTNNLSSMLATNSMAQGAVKVNNTNGTIILTSSTK